MTNFTKSHKNTALTNCRTCSNEISKNAKTCPHCGDTQPLPADIYFKRGVIVFVGTIITAIVLYNVLTFMMGNMQEQMKEAFTHKVKK